MHVALGDAAPDLLLSQKSPDRLDGRGMRGVLVRAFTPG